MSQLAKTTSHLPDQRRGKVLLADLSTSMSGPKEDALKKALKDLLPRHRGTRLVQFGGRVREFKSHEVDQLTPNGNTPMGAALERAWKMRVEQIVLITDGQPTDWTTEDILEEAEEYFFIPIHIVGIGDPYSLELNEPFLKELADITGGSYNRIGEGELYTLSHRIERLLE